MSGSKVEQVLAGMRKHLSFQERVEVREALDHEITRIEFLRVRGLSGSPLSDEEREALAEAATFTPSPPVVAVAAGRRAPTREELADDFARRNAEAVAAEAEAERQAMRERAKQFREEAEAQNRARARSVT